MNTAAEIIQAFGGPTAFAEIIGTSQQNVTNMKARGTIPAAFFRVIVTQAEQRGIDGVTLDLLADLAAKNWNRESSAA